MDLLEKLINEQLLFNKMKKILLVYLPFCTPASPPYSITNLYSFLKNNCQNQIDVLDLNLEFHKLKFPEYQKYYQSMNWDDYENKTKEYSKLTAKTYSENNKKVVNGEKPEFFEELLQKIMDKKPDIVAFSLVYSSQVFYAYSLIKELKQIITVVGGPAVNEILMKSATKALNSELELLDLLSKNKELSFNYSLDFSIYALDEYFTPMPVIPIKTSSTCYYKQCAFCTHFAKTQYYESPVDVIKNTIIASQQKLFFFIDDMLPSHRLLKIADAMKPLNVKWSCQLKPTIDFDYNTLKRLRESGLLSIFWGVESGSDRILNLMKKGTNTKDIENVLSDSHRAGIKNLLYIMFGFPTETKDEFLSTIEFMKKNEKNIDLVFPSIFGLQKGSIVYNDPEKFGLKKIIEEKRTVLEPKISFEIESGLTQKEAALLKKKYKKTINGLNKYPKSMAFFREHMLCLAEMNGSI